MDKEGPHFVPEIPPSTKKLRKNIASYEAQPIQLTYLYARYTSTLCDTG